MPSTAKHTTFVTDAIKILSGPKGDLLCFNEFQQQVTLREMWSLDKLQLWEKSEGYAVNKIDTLAHWRSYTFGE